MPKHVYLFEEGTASMRDLLGGKGAGLAEMTRLGLAVPPGFTITTKACNAYSKSGRFPPGMWKQVDAALSQVESKGGRRFGDPANPLLVSVRSGAKISMPGMMDTVLNIGLNDSTVEALAQMSNERYARDRREHPDDGVRQHGARLGHGGCVHPEPSDGRERAVRGVPPERPGRGRRRGNPNANESRRASGQLSGDLR